MKCSGTTPLSSTFKFSVCLNFSKRTWSKISARMTCSCWWGWDMRPVSRIFFRRVWTSWKRKTFSNWITVSFSCSNRRRNCSSSLSRLTIGLKMMATRGCRILKLTSWSKSFVRKKIILKISTMRWSSSSSIRLPLQPQSTNKFFLIKSRMLRSRSLQAIPLLKASRVISCSVLKEV